MKCHIHLRIRELEDCDADVFIACTAMDEANIVACLTVKRMSMAKTACFVSKEEYIESMNLIKALFQNLVRCPLQTSRKGEARIAPGLPCQV